MKSQIFSFDSEVGWDLSSDSKRLDSPSTFIIVFGDRSFPHRYPAVRQLSEHFPESLIIGSSTAGEILDLSVQSNSMVAMVIKLESSRIKLISREIRKPEDSLECSEKLGQLLIEKDLRAVLVFADGIKSNGSSIVRGLNSTLGSKNIPIFGGLAADGQRFENTWVIDSGTISSSKIVALGIYGSDFHCHAGLGMGWDQFGIERTVTRSRGNILYEVDGKSVLDLYKSYLGKYSSALPSAGLNFPLKIRDSDVREAKNTIRAVMAIDEEEGSITFAGDIPVDSKVQLMMANKERLIEGAYKAAENIVRGIYSNDSIQAPQVLMQNSVTLAISCVGRKLVLGERVVEEIDAIKNALGRRNPLFGFYSYGEISSDSSNQWECEFHNQIMSIFSMSEVMESGAA